jgi:hypothetical protein
MQGSCSWHLEASAASPLLTVQDWPAVAAERPAPVQPAREPAGEGGVLQCLIVSAAWPFNIPPVPLAALQPPLPPREKTARQKQQPNSHRCPHH